MTDEMLRCCRTVYVRDWYRCMYPIPRYECMDPLVSGGVRSARVVAGQVRGVPRESQLPSRGRVCCIGKQDTRATKGLKINQRSLRSIDVLYCEFTNVRLVLFVVQLGFFICPSHGYLYFFIFLLISFSSFSFTPKIVFFNSLYSFHSSIIFYFF